MYVRSALEEKLVQYRAWCRSESDREARLFPRFPQGVFQDRLDYQGRRSPGRADRKGLGHHRGHRSLEVAERENRGYRAPHLLDRVADRECRSYQDRHSPEPAGRENRECRPQAYAC